jgi:hypothetical protein
LCLVKQSSSDLGNDATHQLQAFAGRRPEVSCDGQEPVGRQAALHVGKDFADTGEVLEGCRQGTEAAPVMILTRAVLVQQGFHLPGFQQQAADQRPRQANFSRPHGGQAPGEFEQGPATSADQVAQLAVGDQLPAWLAGRGDRLRRFVHVVFSLVRCPVPGWRATFSDEFASGSAKNEREARVARLARSKQNPGLSSGVVPCCFLLFVPCCSSRSGSYHAGQGRPMTKRCKRITIDVGDW